jgi:chromosome segregation ATPase
VFFFLRPQPCALQVADFANRTASGALTAAVSAEVERLRTQHVDAVREKSAADSKCRKLTDKVAVLEKEKADLQRQLAGERRETNEALAKEKAAQAEAKLARAEGNIARERAEQLQERLAALESRVECRTERPDFAAWSGCRRNCKRSPLLWRGLCRMPL